MPHSNSPIKKSTIDDKYASAIQSVVDETMRIDNLAPVMLNTLQCDVFLQKCIQEIIISTLKEKQPAKAAINAIIDQNKAAKRDRLVNIIVGAFIGALIAAIINFIFKLLPFGK